MKVLVLSAHYGSIDRRIIAEINSLISNGFDVTLVTVPVYSDYENILLCKEKHIIPLIQKNNLSFSNFIRWMFPDFLKKKLRVLHSIFSNKKLNIFFEKNTPIEKYDVIHAHDLSTLEAAFIIKNKYSQKAKVIYDSHELYPHQFHNKRERNFWIYIEKKFIRKCDYIITVNESCLKFIKKFYKLNNNLIYLYNSYGIFSNPKSIDIRKKLKIENKNPIFLFQGGLSNSRNIENLMLAFKSYHEEANLVFIGRGPILNKLQEIKKLKNISNVYFHDWVDQSELPSYIKSVDFGVIPYIKENLLNNKYCTPNKLFEFIYFKKPIISSSLIEVSKIIKKYKIGFTYDFGSQELIEHAIKSFLVNYKDINKNNFDLAKEDLSWSNQEKKLIWLYKEILQLT